MSWSREDAHEAKIKGLTQRMAMLEKDIKFLMSWLEPIAKPRGAPMSPLSEEDVERLKDVVRCFAVEVSEGRLGGISDGLADMRQILGMEDDQN